MPCEPDHAWRRRVELPADSVEGFTVGEEVTVTIKAKVTGLEMRQRENESYGEICLDMDEYSIEGKNEFSELAEDDDE